MWVLIVKCQLIYIYIYIYMCVCVCVCVLICVCLRVHKYACMSVYIHTYTERPSSLKSGLTCSSRPCLYSTLPHSPKRTSVICIHSLTAAANTPISATLLTSLVHHPLDNIPSLISLLHSIFITSTTTNAHEARPLRNAPVDNKHSWHVSLIFFTRLMAIGVCRDANLRTN